jgi:hypothetical protein
MSASAPSTLSTKATLGLRGAAFLTEIGGSIALGLAQQKQGRRIQKNLEIEARQVELIGIINARKRRFEGQRLLGSQIAAFAKSGVAPGVGSALDIELRTRALEELAALEEQLPFKIRAATLRQQGKIAKKGARGQGIQTILKGVSRAIDQLDPGASVDPDEPIEPNTSGDLINLTNYQDVAPVVPEGQILASLQGVRIDKGDTKVVDLAPDRETLGVA